MEACGSYVFQPGSTVATSLSKGEAKDKHCGILNVYTSMESNMALIPLKESRKMYIDTFSVNDLLSKDTKRIGNGRVDEEWLTESIRKLLDEV